MIDQIVSGLEAGVQTAANVLPTFLLFLLVLVVGYVVARVIEKVLDGILDRLDFDAAVERGGIRKAMSKSKYDPSDLLAKLAFYAVMLFVLQLAFGLFGTNPISDLINDVIAYLPQVFAAILIVVVGAAVAAAVKEIVEAALGGVDYGRGLAIAASTAILVVTGFAAVSQLGIAEDIVNALFYALLVALVGVVVVAVGGSGVTALRPYWDRYLQRVDEKSDQLEQVDSDQAKQRVQQRARTRQEQAREAGSGDDGAGGGGVGAARTSRPATQA